MNCRRSPAITKGMSCVSRTMHRYLIAVCAECGVGVAVPALAEGVANGTPERSCTCGAEDFTRFGRVATTWMEDRGVA